MVEDQAQTNDEITTEVAESPFILPRKSYTVISEHGLFKNGKEIAKGETVELDEKTAAAFIEAGDIE